MLVPPCVVPCLVGGGDAASAIETGQQDGLCVEIEDAAAQLGTSRNDCCAGQSGGCSGCGESQISRSIRTNRGCDSRDIRCDLS